MTRSLARNHQKKESANSPKTMPPGMWEYLKRQFAIDARRRARQQLAIEAAPVDTTGSEPSQYRAPPCLTVAVLPAVSALPSGSGAPMTSLAVVRFKTRALHSANERLAFPKWTTDLEPIREMDPPKSLASTVSLRSGWDVVSARPSSSSIFNHLFSSDRLTAPTVSSTVSAASGSESSVVSIPPTFFAALAESSTTSSLFADPTSAHSSSSIASVESSGCSSCLSILPGTTSSASFCSACQLYHGEAPMEISDSISSVAPFAPVSREASCSSVSSISTDSSGYETEAPAVLRRAATTITATQTQALSQTDVARMLAECDIMVEMLMAMRKKLEQLL